VRRDDKVFMEKTCPQDGEISFLLSLNADYYEQLTRAYFTIVPAGMPLKVIELSLTPKCDMGCPICSVKGSINRKSHDMSSGDVEKIIHEHPDKKVILWGLECTENKDLEDILRILKSYKKKPFLFTNGNKLADLSYLKKLKEAGLGYVYLQFDGFDDAAYRVFRNRSLINEKLAALENLKKLKIPTIFNVTLAKGVNDHQINNIINYAVEHSDFVRQIGFLPLIRVGGADRCKEDMIPKCHEFLEIIQNQTKSRITIDNFRAFQKLMYVVYRFSKFRRCFWFTLFILVRNPKTNGYKTIDEYIDLKKAEKIVDQYVNLLEKNGKASFWDALLLLFRLSLVVVNFNTLSLCINALKFILLGKKLEDARSGSRLLFITCTDFCDFYKMDLDMADDYCEELMALKDKKGKIYYEYTYRTVIDATKEFIGVKR